MDHARRAYIKEIGYRELIERVRSVDVRLQLEEQGYIVKGWINGRELQRKQIKNVWKAGRASHAVDTIADGAALIVDPESGELETVNIEIDGQYYGKMLESKINGFNNGGKTIWATSAARAVLVNKAIARLGVNQEVIVI